MINQIFEKLRTKRHYRRQPQCANKNGICEFRICRCNYAYDLQRAAQGRKPKLVLAIIAEE